MVTVAFCPAPGFLCDLVQLGVLYFNPLYAQDIPLSPDAAKEETSFCTRMAGRFGDFPRELELFFRLRENGCYLTERCLTPFLEKNFTLVSAPLEFLNGLEPQATERELLRYCLPQLDSAQVDACLSSCELCSKQILASDLEDPFKLMLLSFCLDPASYVALLRDTLLEKAELLEEYCREHQPEVLCFQQECGLAEPDPSAPQIPRLSDLTGGGKMGEAASRYYPLLWEQGGQAAYTLCHVARYLEKLVCCGGMPCFVLGIRRDQLRQGAEIGEADLALFGRVLAEPNRLALLRLLMERGECCKAELCDALNLSMTAAQYHVSILQDAKLLLAVSRKRTLYYRLNADRVRSLLILTNGFFLG